MEEKQLIVSDPVFIKIRQQLETWRNADNKGKAIPSGKNNKLKEFKFVIQGNSKNFTD